jgi:hypothetical protein
VKFIVEALTPDDGAPYRGFAACRETFERDELAGGLEARIEMSREQAEELANWLNAVLWNVTLKRYGA